MKNKKELKARKLAQKEELAVAKREHKKRKKFFKELRFKSAEIKDAEFYLKKINSLGRSIKNLTDEQLKNKTRAFKQRLSRGETLDDIKIEAFAVAREATYRVLNKRPFDVQMLGGLILNMGSVAEMKTGEGKTITSIAPIYLNALSGDGVIVSTVNEYLAERDSEEMGEVFKWLGLTVGLNRVNSSNFAKKQAYNADITYSIHSELGFDYLRDNTVRSINEKVQRGLNYALIDEVDSILIDEAKTPLIISGGEKVDSGLYTSADLFAKSLKPEDYHIDHESKSIALTFSGVNKANEYYKVANIYLIENSEIVHRIQNALRANYIMMRDAEYVVLKEKIELVDQFTGRIMEGRSYSEGLQQAIQAKEGVEIEPETKTLATITYQNFFRMFKKLSGMTGTAKTEEQEFLDTYNMRVNVIPTNKPVIRVDHEDQIYLTMVAKFNALIEEIKSIHKTGQPILIGTAQVEESEYLHQLLVKENLPHTVLNAKQNASEAEIISHAGELNSITIATNMAGRGTDIKLGPGVKEVGGLYVLGTNKSESRRIDNQLKGRSGRQGDVGSSKFFLSIEDQLIQRFALQDKWKELFKDAGENKIVGAQIIKAFERAQKKIEGFNYDSRKSVLNYDDVIRKQRELLYAQRDIILSQADLSIIVKKMIDNTAKQMLYLPNILNDNGTINYELLIEIANQTFLKSFESQQLKVDHIIHLPVDSISEYFKEYFLKIYNENRYLFIKNDVLELLQSFEREAILTHLDRYWQDHINIMDKLRSSTNVVQYSQKNPYQVYIEEGTSKFHEMIDSIAFNSVSQILIEMNQYLRTKRASESDELADILPSEAQAVLKQKLQELERNVELYGHENQSVDIELNFANDLERDLFHLDLVANTSDDDKIKK